MLALIYFRSKKSMMSAKNPIEYRIDFEPESPIVAAALKIAKVAHEGQPRGKEDPSIPYIIHPIMVHDILAHFGVKDEITLAVALLHDAKEDCQRYRENPDAMREDIERELMQAGMTDSAALAFYIDDICTELTNAKEMQEGKRTWQVEHVGKISHKAALVKIVDQMASELDNIMMANAPEWEDKDRARAWSYKALNVVKSAANGDEKLKFWQNLHKVLFKYSMNITDTLTREDADALRATFDFERAVNDAHTMCDSVNIPVVAEVTHRNPDTLQQGVVSIQLDEKGDVAYYSCLSNPQGDRNDTRNHTSDMLLGKIEESATIRRVTVGDREVLRGRMVRTNKIKPSMPLTDFCSIANECGALSFELKTAAQSTTREMQESTRAIS